MCTQTLSVLTINRIFNEIFHVSENFNAAPNDPEAPAPTSTLATTQQPLVPSSTFPAPLPLATSSSYSDMIQEPGTSAMTMNNSIFNTAIESSSPFPHQEHQQFPTIVVVPLRISGASSSSASYLHLPSSSTEHRSINNVEAASSQTTSFATAMSPLVSQFHELEREELCLNKELHELRENSLCRVCLDREANAVLMPCAHLVLCSQCTSQLAQCPVCRAPIHYTCKAVID